MSHRDIHAIPQKLTLNVIALTPQTKDLSLNVISSTIPVP